MSKDELPSVNDYLKESDLPSYKDFIEKKEELPSVNEYILETSTVEEDLPSVEDFIEKVDETIEEPVVSTGNLTEILHLINAVRRDIPEIPEIKYYDEELEKISAYIEQVKEGIPEIPEIRYYDNEVEAICEQIDQVREEIKDLPEVKYYDEQVTNIEDRIDSLRQEVVNLPEVKYYDKEIEEICEQIDKVKAEIPTFPKWVNEVNEVPDFSWIGKTFSVIDDDFIKVGDNINDLKNKFNYDIEVLAENLDIKDFEKKIEIKEIKEHLDETKAKIYDELKETVIKIWEHHDTFKDDDRKLKKQILGEYNILKQNIDKELKEINCNSVKTDELLLEYFTELRSKISGLPEVKYYDEDIDYVKSDIEGLYKIVEEIKSSHKKLQEEQQTLNEGLLNIPPDVNNSDPLTPLDQNYATLEDLQNHYKLFINRVQQQLATLGGGGETKLQYLDDIVGVATNLSAYDGMYLQVDTSASDGKKFKFSSVSGGGGGSSVWTTTSAGINTTSNVGIGTTNPRFLLEVGSVGASGTSLFVNGDARVTGITTATSFVKSGGTASQYLMADGTTSTLTFGIANTNAVKIDDADAADDDYAKFTATGIEGRSAAEVKTDLSLNNVENTALSTWVGTSNVTTLGTIATGTWNGTAIADGYLASTFLKNVVEDTTPQLGGNLDLNGKYITGSGGANITGVITATDGKFSGNVTVGGTLTYEDVTNVDSVGIVTAGKGVRVTTGGLVVTAGVSTFNGAIDANERVNVGSGTLDSIGLAAYNDSTVAGRATIYAENDQTSGNLFLGYGGGALKATITGTGDATFVGDVSANDVSIADKIIHTGDTNTAIRFPSADTITAETAGSERMKITSNGGILLSNGILVERCKIVTTAWSTTNDISLDDGNVFLNTANLGGTNNTIDITSTNGLNTDLEVGDMTSVTLITAVNAATAYINEITIGASAVTESWVGGSAPTDGGSSGYDVYTFNIIKTASATYVVIANQVKGS